MRERELRWINLTQTQSKVGLSFKDSLARQISKHERLFSTPQLRRNKQSFACSCSFSRGWSMSLGTEALSNQHLSLILGGASTFPRVGGNAAPQGNPNSFF
jgi:hypothetical protein